MTPTRHRGGHGARRLRAAGIAAAALTAALGVFALSAFHVPVNEIDPEPALAESEVVSPEIIGIRTFIPPSTIDVAADIPYGTRGDGTLLTLDVCSPAAVDGAETTALPAVVSIHGGSWARGDKANDDWRRVCLWLASEGFVAASVNYRLVPDATFPAAIDDVSLAVEFLRANAADYGIDAARIGAFGGSAGGNLAALLGARGDGPLDVGSRVAAVVELSGPIELTTEALEADASSMWLHGIVGAYLGCDGGKCPAASEASAITHLDASDPPFFVGHSEAEVVPVGQAERFAAALLTAGVPLDLAIVPGEDHSIGILDDTLRTRVSAFLHTHLAAS